MFLIGTPKIFREDSGEAEGTAALPPRGPGSAYKKTSNFMGTSNLVKK